MRRLRLLVFASVVALGACLLSAHEFWVQPLDFRPAVGARVGMRLLVGTGMNGDPVPRDPHRIRDFYLLAPDGTRQEIQGDEGAEPAGTVRVAAPGIHVAVYRSHDSRIELAAEKFEAYLREVGLEHIATLRASRGETAQPGRETYSRCAKALLRAGVGPGGDATRRVGLPLEIVPERDPYGSAAGDELSFVVWQGEARAAGVLVQAFNRSAPEFKLVTVTGRTDREGRVSLRLPVPGVWLLSAVEMFAAPPAKGTDWESLWASLTFDLAPAAVSRAAESRPR